MTDIATAQVECNLCGIVYTIAIGYPTKAPHGPNKDCRGYFKPYLPPEHNNNPVMSQSPKDEA